MLPFDAVNTFLALRHSEFDNREWLPMGLVTNDILVFLRGLKEDNTSFFMMRSVIPDT